jgi:serine/threonine-protein kinase
MANVGQPADAVDRSGELVGGRYELLSLLGRGAQSEVYRARDRVHGDLVALKILQWATAEAVERMFREALIVSELRDVEAVRVLEQCTTDDGTPALVMELLEGSDLAGILSGREREGTRNDFAWMAPILEPVVRTLQAAHDRGIVHRDVKAENVFVIDPIHGGGVRLLDFGFAKNARMPGITAVDMVAGSPSYIAPEVWENGVARATHLADVYAVGVLVFRVLAGRTPFVGKMVEIAKAAIGSARPSLWAIRTDLPRDVDAWVFQVLAKKPEERFENVTAAWRALAGLLDA